METNHTKCSLKKMETEKEKEKKFPSERKKDEEKKEVWYPISKAHLPSVQATHTHTHTHAHTHTHTHTTTHSHLPLHSSSKLNQFLTLWYIEHSDDSTLFG